MTNAIAESRRKHMAVMDYGEADWQSDAMHQNKLLHDALTRAETAEANLAKAVAALRFYADVSNYEEGIVGTTHVAPMWSESDYTEFEWDNGDNARKALAEIKGETK
jgi:hypothetical protein